MRSASGPGQPGTAPRRASHSSAQRPIRSSKRPARRASRTRGCDGAIADRRRPAAARTGRAGVDQQERLLDARRVDRQRLRPPPGRRRVQGQDPAADGRVAFPQTGRRVARRPSASPAIRAIPSRSSPRPDAGERAGHGRREGRRLAQPRALRHAALRHDAHAASALPSPAAPRTTVAGGAPSARASATSLAVDLAQRVLRLDPHAGDAGLDAAPGAGGRSPR